MALHFECRINKNVLLQTVFFFGDFAHWVTVIRFRIHIATENTRYLPEYF